MSQSDVINQQFLALYQEWLEGVLVEQKMIREEKWGALAPRMKLRQQLMDRVTKLESLYPSWREIQSEALRQCIQQVIGMETLNQDLLRERGKSLKSKVQDVQSRVGKTRQLHQHYLTRQPKRGGQAFGQG